MQLGPRSHRKFEFPQNFKIGGTKLIPQQRSPLDYKWQFILGPSGVDLYSRIDDIFLPFLLLFSWAFIRAWTEEGHWTFVGGSRLIG